LARCPPTRAIWSIAPDASRLALLANSEPGQQVCISTATPGPYSTIVQLSKLGQGDSGPRLLMISPDATQVAYVATKGPTDYVMWSTTRRARCSSASAPRRFAPVGHRLAFVASKGGKQYLVVDGKMSPGYARVAASELAFTADGKPSRLCRADQRTAGQVAGVVDGKEGASYESVSSLRPRPQWPFALRRPQVNKHLGQLHGDRRQEGPTFAVFQPAIFSQDGTHVGYNRDQGPERRGYVRVAAIGRGHRRQGRADYPEVAQLTFSPDGKRSVYTGTETGTQRVNKYAMVDGQKSLDYVGATSYLFSPDSQHLAYVATSSGANGVKYVVVLDGHEQDAYAQVDFESLRFSPDGQHLGLSGPRAGSGLRRDRRQEERGPRRHRSAHVPVESGAWAVPVQNAAEAPTRGNAGIGTQPAGGDPIAELVANNPMAKHSAAVVLKAAGSSQQSAQVMLDGKPIGETYGSVDQLQISADGVHVAFLAGATQQSGKKGMFAVFDGHEGPGISASTGSSSSPTASTSHTTSPPKAPSTTSWSIRSRTGLRAGSPWPHAALRGAAIPAGWVAGVPGGDGGQAESDGLPRRFASLDSQVRRWRRRGGRGAPGYSQIYAFGKVEKDGTKPAVLTAAPDGTLYGATSAGGKYQKGVLFKLKPDGSDYTIIHPFAGGRSDGGISVFHLGRP